MRTVEYADDIVLLAKEETVKQGMIDRLAVIGRCYGMEMKRGKAKVVRTSKTIPTSKYYRSKTAGGYGIFQLFE